MKITLKTIAEAADVSVSTASRALKGHPSISKERTLHIRDIAERLNYPSRNHVLNGKKILKPNGILAGKTIALVSLGMHHSLLSLPAVALTINSAVAELSLHGAKVTLAHIPDLEHAPHSLAVNKLDGIIISGNSQGDAIGKCQSEVIQRLRELPSVWLLARPLACWGDVAGSNDYTTGQLAARYLIEQGHRRLAFVNPKPDHKVFMRREDGFIAYARRQGIDVCSFCEAPASGWPLPVQPALTTDAVETLVERLLQHQPRPTAIFAAADSVAAALYRAFSARGIIVGEEISVISANDDQALTAGLYPRLTTFDIHAEQIGRVAVAQLATRLSQSQPLVENEILLEPTLVERDSVRQHCQTSSLCSGMKAS
ncbi:MAG: LacI family DNA-binding transcriptional regulator [Planctomycetaceae bacterium]